MKRKRFLIILTLAITLQIILCLLSGLVINHRRYTGTPVKVIRQPDWDPQRGITIHQSMFVTRGEIDYGQSYSPAFFGLPQSDPQKHLASAHNSILLGLEKDRCQKSKNGTGLTTATFLAYGFPFRSNYGAVGMDATQNLRTQPLITSHLVAGESWFDPSLKVLCWGIHWPAFIVNTIIYFLLLTLPKYTYQKIKYQNRLNRNHCPNCNYDLRGHTNNPNTPCPECGHDQPNPPSK